MKKLLLFVLLLLLTVGLFAFGAHAEEEAVTFPTEARAIRSSRDA